MSRIRDVRAVLLSLGWIIRLYIIDITPSGVWSARKNSAKVIVPFGLTHAIPERFNDLPVGAWTRRGGHVAA